jgi:hypothetical protein
MDTNKKLVCGVGYNDLTLKGNEKVYQQWTNMLNRCYDPKFHIKNPTYKGCYVCEEWLTFSKFKEWFNVNNRIGMQNDKDILNKGNKIYCPEYCRFVPQEINKLLNGYDNGRGKYKPGVSWNKRAQKYSAQINRGDDKEHIGLFATEQEAFNAYKIEKELWIKSRADWYYSIGLIGLEINTALHDWKI